MDWLPWRVRNAIDIGVSVASYAGNRIGHLRQAPQGPLKVQFSAPPYGVTGGSVAVMAVANLLSTAAQVRYRAKPNNFMNRFAAPTLALDPEVALDSDIYVIESGEDLELVRRMKASGGRIVVTAHGNTSQTEGAKNHNYDWGHIEAVTRMADSVQYIASIQAPAFDKYPNLHRRLISNTVPQVRKDTRTRNAGLVCDTTVAWKNAPASLQAALASKAEHVHVWGRNRGEAGDSRTTWHGFESDKARIYASFDVLVHLSLYEGQPMVILEAMSAGIPCVLADLPVYDIFHGLPGIWLVDPADPAAAAAAVDAALDAPEAVRQGLRQTWQAKYSPEALRREWLDYFAEVMRLPRTG